MTIYNYDETKMIFIPLNTPVSMECKLTHNCTSSFGPIKPFPAFLSLLINGTIMWGKSMAHEDRENNDNKEYNIGDFYTDDEIQMEIEKIKGTMKVLCTKLQYRDHTLDEYHFSEEGYLK